MMVAHEITPPRCGGKASPLPALFSSLDFRQNIQFAKDSHHCNESELGGTAPAGASQMPTCCTDKSRQA
jgi:hypothetical protein